ETRRSARHGGYTRTTGRVVRRLATEKERLAQAGASAARLREHPPARQPERIVRREGQPGAVRAPEGAAEGARARRARDGQPHLLPEALQPRPARGGAARHA